MKVILLADVQGTGRRFDVKNVSDGYAMNFLFPKKLAELATSQKTKEIERMRQATIEEIKIKDDLLQKNLDALKDTVIEISETANEKNHLFKGITEETIVTALYTQTRIKLPVDTIALQKPIKETGEFTISVEVLGKKSSFILKVTAR